jgi:3-deoxy-D-manno-octulosonic-acid transferase
MGAVYVIYNLLLAVALLASAPYWFVRLLRQGKYREGLGNRLGIVPPHLRSLAAAGKPVIWVHAVSVGEILAVAGLIQEMRKRFADYAIAISTTTSTGHKLAGDRFGPENVFFFPLDLSFAVQRYMRLLRPRLVVIAETEFWPNFLRAARLSGAAVAVVNARISDRSYPRYRKFASLLRIVLRGVDRFLAQTEEDARRLVGIGAEQDRVQMAGNLKFDAAAPAAKPEVAQLLARLQEISAGPVVVIGSTVEGEEQMLLATLRAIIERHPRALVILAPRHKERFDAVAELLNNCGVPFTRRSHPEWPRNVTSGSILLLDTIGELASIYSLAHVAFVGGSLAPRGGHNILEPAGFGLPIIVGPHTENFRDIVQRFADGSGVLVVRDQHEFQSALLRLLSDPVERKQLGERALEVLKANQGATERTVTELEKLLLPQPRQRKPSPGTPLARRTH